MITEVRNNIKIYLYGGWRKYGIQEVIVRYVSENGKKALADYKTGIGDIIPNGNTYTDFAMTREEAVIKAKEVIQKEIEAKNRAIARLLQIGINLK